MSRFFGSRDGGIMTLKADIQHRAWGLVLGLAIVGWAMPSYAQKCPKPAKPKINLTILNPKANLVHANTLTEINRMFGVRAKSVGAGLNGWHAPGGENGVIRGLTRAQLGFGEFTMRPYWKKYGAVYCYSAKELNIEIGYVQHTVFIPRIYGRHSCEYKVVRAHENKHAAYNRRAMRDFGSKVEARLQQELAKTGAIPVRNKEDGLSAYGKVVNKVLSALLNEMHRTYNPYHEQIDTPENYRKEAAKCEKWVKDVR